MKKVFVRIAVAVAIVFVLAVIALYAYCALTRCGDYYFTVFGHEFCLPENIVINGVKVLSHTWTYKG